MAYTLEYKSIILLLYLAIEKNCRSKGCGGEFLHEVNKYHCNKAILLDIEQVIPGKDNYLERKKRKEFYLRNGFFSSEIGFELLGVDYEILYYGQKVSKELCKELYEQTSFNIEKYYSLG